MRAVFLLAVIYVNLFSSCDCQIFLRFRTWPQARSVTYTIRNEEAEPNFEETRTVDLPLFARVPFIWAMERAADADDNFRFSVRYISRDAGYAVTSINGLSTNGEDQEWEFLRSPSTVINSDVTRLIPADGDTLILNFKDNTAEDEGGELEEVLK